MIDLTKHDFTSLSVKDLLDAREAYHVHLAHLQSVYATAIGRYLIRDSDRNATEPFRRHGQARQGRQDAAGSLRRVDAQRRSESLERLLRRDRRGPPRRVAVSGLADLRPDGRICRRQQEAGIRLCRGDRRALHRRCLPAACTSRNSTMA
ncbi:hypothetical protein HU230_0026325 [Bradyrhizobium quebecense]|uniref:Uncharacterized protein n=1 Tax=Bradyrhizobium quebecense TaxID=2748629 RepID=A0A974ABJ3_9BRAD|nr:hypothetical protein [Bradyrhizobium quebecense]UGA41870.1 hypothetical protein HU230_0026325 [Bradyrhizobium quebecense]